MTIKQFLKQHPGAAFDLMTPGGYCFLTPEAARSLLQGGSHTESQRVITAEELLPQLIVHVGEHKGNTWFFQTDFPSEMKLTPDASPSQRLQARLTDNYTEFLAELDLPSTLSILDRAAEIAATKQVYDELSTEGNYEEYTEYLLKFPNPLEVVRDIWMSHNDVDIHEELDHALFAERESDQATLDEETSVQEHHCL